jgi:hypothetical protein
VPHDTAVEASYLGPVDHPFFHVGEVYCFRIVEHTTCRSLVIAIAKDQVVGGGKCHRVIVRSLTVIVLQLFNESSVTLFISSCKKCHCKALSLCCDAGYSHFGLGCSIKVYAFA